MSEGWIETTLGEVATWGAGGTPKAGDPRYYEGGTIPWAVIADVQDDYISITEKSITEEGLRTIGHHAPEGSVLVTMYGTVGRVAITSIPMATNQAIAWGIPNLDLTSPEFLFFWLRSYQPQLDRMARGATQRNINRAIIKDTSILLPPLPVQRRIVDLMTHLDSHLANLRAERDVVEALLVSSRDALLTPNDNWADSTIENATTKIGSGATPRGGESSYRKSGVALIRSQNVYNFRFEWDGLAHIGPEQANALNNVQVAQDDLLLNITGASVNRCCIVPPETLPARVNQHVAILRCDTDMMDPQFLLHLLRRSDNKAALDGMAGSGTTRQALTKSQIQQFKISFPDLESQRSLGDTLHSLVSSASALEVEVQTLTDFRASLLSNLLSRGLEVASDYDSLLSKVA